MFKASKPLFTEDELDEIESAIESAFHANVNWTGAAWNMDRAEIQRSILDKIRGTK